MNAAKYAILAVSRGQNSPLLEFQNRVFHILAGDIGNGDIDSIEYGF